MRILCAFLVLFAATNAGCNSCVGVVEVIAGDGGAGPGEGATANPGGAPTSGGGGQGGQGGGAGGAGGSGGFPGATCELPHQDTLKAHYRGDVVVTREGTAKVTSWPDMTGHGLDLVPDGVAPTNPEQVATTLGNGMPALRFTGDSGSGLRATSGPPKITDFAGGQQNPRMAFVAVVRTTQVQGHRAIISLGDMAANYPRLWLGSNHDTSPSEWIFAVTRGAIGFCDDICNVQPPNSCETDCSAFGEPGWTAIGGGLNSNKWSILIASKEADKTWITSNGSRIVPPAEQQGFDEFANWQFSALWVGGIYADDFFVGDIAEIALFGDGLPESEANDLYECLVGVYGPL